MQKTQKMPTGMDKKKNVWIETGYDWIGAAVIALALVAVLFSTFFRVVNVSGRSMADTLQNGEKLLLSCWNETPTYGDIVVIQRDGGTPLIKRVIGVGGDKIYINDAMGTVYRDGEELHEPYVRGRTIDKNHEEAIVVPEGYIYVLGDNREDSLDSRDLGCQSLDDVVGIVTYRLNPFQSLRKGD